jgi:Tfp pilus assembly protein PilN
MKSDINLLQKRKGKKYSAQKVAMLLLVIALFAGVVYAGFMFPGRARSAVRLELSGLSGELVSASGEGQNLAGLADQYATRKAQLDALTVLNAARSDVGEYLDAVEKAQPVSVNISSLSISDRTISISGIATDDYAIAAFCVHLRETGKFISVFLQNSAANIDGGCVFNVIIKLPVTLNSSGLLPSEPEEGNGQATGTGEVAQ